MIALGDPPAFGQKTKRQQRQGAQAIIDIFGAIPGYSKPDPGTYDVYRRMSKDPELALCRAIVTGPIIAGSWSFEAKEGVPDERKQFIQDMFEPQRPSILHAGLRYLEFGWRPFEKVWDIRDGRLVIRKLKPLLYDITEVEVNEKDGSFAGVKQDKISLGPEKCFVATYDGDNDNYYGCPRHENSREAWCKQREVSERGHQLATKVASVIPQIHYPEGVGKNESGQDVSNATIASTILAALGKGKGIAVPNMFASEDAPRQAAELAGKSAWVISFLESASASSALSGMTDRERYFDAKKIRGWLRPERAVIEAQTAGSRADSETGKDWGVLDSEAVDADFARQFNWYVIDDVLAYNFGEDARGSVYIKPAPIRDEKRLVFQKLFDAVLNNPGTLEEALTQTDMDAVWDVMEVPKLNSKVISFTATQEPEEPVEDEPMPVGAD